MFPTKTWQPSTRSKRIPPTNKLFLSIPGTARYVESQSPYGCRSETHSREEWPWRRSSCRRAQKFFPLFAEKNESNRLPAQLQMSRGRCPGCSATFRWLALFSDANATIDLRNRNAGDGKGYSTLRQIPKKCPRLRFTVHKVNQYAGVQQNRWSASHPTFGSAASSSNCCCLQLFSRRR